MQSSSTNSSAKASKEISRKDSKVDSSSLITSAKARADAIVIRELKSLYNNKLLPVERKYLFSKFHAPEILPSELDAKPQVLFLGQYSVGKTTFIQHLIGQDYPGMHIGPEPTTDKFIAVVHGENGNVIKGNSLTGVDELPFAGLSTFGGSFLNKFEAAVLTSPRLKSMTIIDTPGVLSGEKQRIARGYDFSRVSRWFAERSDLILLVFDAYKLDISDEFRSVIEELRMHEDKVRCVLNKADGLDSESLMRVYGALLWSMGKIFKGSEVARVYVGSFSNEPIKREELKPLFDKDRNQLMNDLNDLPKACAMRKVNEIVKRIRLLIVHICVLSHLRSKLPYFWGLERRQQKLIEDLPIIFKTVQLAYNLSEGDFPPASEFRAVLQLHDFRTFPHLDRRILNALKEILATDIPRIVKHVTGVKREDEINLDDEEEVMEDSGKNDAEIKKRSIPFLDKQYSLLVINDNKVDYKLIITIVSSSLIIIFAIVFALYWENLEPLFILYFEKIMNSFKK